MHRPQPTDGAHARPVDARTDAEKAAQWLHEGQSLRITDHYRTGVDILAALEARLPAPEASAPYAERRAHARAWADATRRLLAPVESGQVALRGSGPSGFFQELYPDLGRFWIPFVDAQELHRAWRFYDEGVQLAVLGHRVHPFYGTYAPTRTEHLELFGTWLSGYDGARGLAVDVGTGCGVLALMLRKAGFARVVATDSNPNAVESVRRELERLTVDGIEPVEADLLGSTEGPVDLIAFNPPWIPGEIDTVLDAALTFEPGLFERFFDQALEVLSDEGRIVLLFSNIMELVRPEVAHPIEAELEKGRLTLVQKLRRKVKGELLPSGKRRRTKERVEVWELGR